MICQLLYHLPILLDAATAAVAQKGNRFLARWADIMTGNVLLFLLRACVHYRHDVKHVCFAFGLCQSGVNHMMYNKLS